MSTKKVLVIFAIVLLVISFPFVIIHLIAGPNDAPITPLQHLVAALANFFGPWGVVIVRLFDFPNAGLRSFSWAMAIGLTLLGAMLLILPVKIRNRTAQILLTVIWGIFVVVWFGVACGRSPMA